MPRGTVAIFESAENEVSWHTYYCLRCGKDTLLLSRYLASHPRRQTDGAYVVGEESIKKLSCARGEVKSILRIGRGAERQHRLKCEMCGVFVAYRERDVDDVDVERTFVLPGILSANPTISLRSHEARELSVPDAISEAEVEGTRCVVVKLQLSFGAHTRVQVGDVMTKVVLLQLRDSLEGNALRAKEAVAKFFCRLLDLQRGDAQLLDEQEARPASASAKARPARGGSGGGVQRIALRQVSCGFVYAQLLRAMTDIAFLLPNSFGGEAPAIGEKRTREEAASETAPAAEAAPAAGS